MASFLSFLEQAATLIGGQALNRGCKVILSCAGSSVVFPVDPPDFKVTNGYNNSTLNINSLGDVNMKGKRALSSISFSSFFPAQQYDFVRAIALNPYTYVEQIKGFANNNQPCRLIISGTAVNTPVTIESFDYREQDGTSDVYFDITLKEYRYIRPTSEALNAITQLSSRVAESIEEKTVTIYPAMDAMDAAAKVVAQLHPIAEQGSKQLDAYLAIAKAGLNAGDTIKATKLQLQIGNNVVKL